MTGSGKTGLCLSLLEEAAIDEIPVIAIDPKGDIGNLLLTFPQLSAQDLTPWVDAEQARRQHLTLEQFAEQQSDLWKTGLRESDQALDRIAKLRDTVSLAIYTPGSTSGIPLSMLNSFNPPTDTENAEILKDKLQNAVTAILSMAGIKADPLRSREYILLASILEANWLAGTEVSLSSLVQSVQKPPVQQIGAFDLESFYPAKERFELAMALNNLLASPGFEVWTNGEPLQIDRLLYSPDGKPCVSIISTAHLSDGERMFVTTQILNELVSWMREQRGTTSLRAILYMDELYGYLPPVENPPSKRPLLTLLKQARAFGLGVVLSTQNPVDLDYKALSNAGTWFIGRLQTERDKKRLLDGLEEAITTSGATLNRAETEEILSNLGNRVFLVHNVHQEASQVFQTRWALSYLRGPLSRSEIKQLMNDSSQKAVGAVSAEDAGTATASSPAPTTAAKLDSERSRKATTSGADHAAEDAISTAPPVTPPQINQYFWCTTQEPDTVYTPCLVAIARVQYTDARSKIDVAEEVSVIVPFAESGALPVDWQEAERSKVSPKQLTERPAASGKFATPPAAALQAKSYTKWTKEFSSWIVENCRIAAYRHIDSKMVSDAGEDAVAFKVRLRQRQREQRDKSADDLHKRYATKLATMRDRVMRAQQAVERETMQAQQSQWQSAVDVGAGILGAFMGSRRGASTSVRRAAGSAGKVVRQQQDVEHARDSLNSAQQQLADLETQFADEMAELEAHHGSEATIETIEVRPKKTGITVQVLGLLWSPEHDSRQLQQVLPTLDRNTRSLQQED